MKFLCLNISIKLHDLVYRPRSVTAEIVIKINKDIDPLICNIPYILPLIKQSEKDPNNGLFQIF